MAGLEHNKIWIPKCLTPKEDITPLFQQHILIGSLMYHTLGDEPWARYWARVTLVIAGVFETRETASFLKIYILRKQKEIGTSRILSASNWYFTRLKGWSIYAPLSCSGPEQNLPRLGQLWIVWIYFFSLTSLPTNIHYQDRMQQTD